MILRDADLRPAALIRTLEEKVKAHSLQKKLKSQRASAASYLQRLPTQNKKQKTQKSVLSLKIKMHLKVSSLNAKNQWRL